MTQVKPRSMSSHNFTESPGCQIETVKMEKFYKAQIQMDEKRAFEFFIKKENCHLDPRFFASFEKEKKIEPWRFECFLCPGNGSTPVTSWIGLFFSELGGTMRKLRTKRNQALFSPNKENAVRHNALIKFAKLMNTDLLEKKGRRVRSK